MEDVLFRCRAQGTTKEGSRVRMSPRWGFAQRGDLILTTSAVVFDRWRIPYTEIEDATLVRLGVIWWRLIVRGRETVYQFVLRPASLWTLQATVDPFWGGPLPFPMRQVRGRLERGSVMLWFMLPVVLLGVGAIVAALNWFD